jgi:hypothetical protein
MGQNRRDEQFAKEAFSRFLTKRHSTLPQWEPGSQPPDFWLDIAQRPFAVEVTQVMESLAVGPIVLTERGANFALRQAIQQLEHQAREAGLLRGFYLIHVCPLPDLRAILPELRARLFIYLQNTAAVPAADCEELWRGQHGQRWTVRKLHTKTAALDGFLSLGGAKWEGEVRKELRKLLSASLADKVEKTRAIREDVIVLLVDAYHYADSGEWLRAANGLDTSRFHTVARVYLDYECQILSTVELGWRAPNGNVDFCR